MATTHTWNAEGVTVGAEVTASNQGASGSAGTPAKTGTASMVGTSTAGEVIHGARSVKITSAAEQAYLIWTHATTQGATGARAYFRVPSAPAAEFPLLLLMAGTTVTGSIVLRTDGRFRVNDAVGFTAHNTLAGTGQVTFPATFAIDFAIQTGTTTTDGRASFALYKTAAVDATADYVMPELTANNFGTTGVTAVRAGKAGAQAAGAPFVMEMDSVEIRDTYALVGPVVTFVNTPPTVTMGANQTVTVGGTATVTATATDPGGAITSRAWTFDEYPGTTAPTLTGATTGTATFTAATAGRYVLRHTVTDDAGATTSGTVKVFAPSAATLRTIPVDGTGVGTWTKAGGATTDGGALADESDTTYIESPDATATAATRRIPLVPSAVRSTGQVTVRVRQSAAGTITGRVRLFSGTTQVKEWTVPLTTTFADQTLTLTSGELATISNWNELGLEFVAVA